MKKEQTFFLAMDKACGKDGLRPIMTNVYFHDGYMVATDAYIIIKAKVSKFCNFENKNKLETLNGKFLHWNKFAQVAKIKYARILDEGIEDVNQGIVYKFTQESGKYPNYQHVFDNLAPAERGSFCIDPALAIRFFTILKPLNLGYSAAVKLFLNGANQGLKVISKDANFKEDDFVAIIMPVMEND